MAQGPEPLRKELAFFRRLLIKQERELADINKKADRRDRSRETLEVRTRTRKTRRAIDGIKAQMGKRGMDSQDSDGSTSRSETETLQEQGHLNTHRPPSHHYQRSPFNVQG